jgi:hypothetical protein
VTLHKYEPSGVTTKNFHEDKSFVRGIMGPVGSGKSTACVIELIRRAQMQERSPDGIRRSRFAIIRNSYPELKSTTLKTWAQWCPTGFGRFTQDSPITHHVKTEGFDMEVIFLALDKEEDVKKLLSLELTGAWINEAREIRRNVLDMLTSRVGRYPGAMLGGCTWSGVIMDTNPPDSENWWFKASEGDKIEGWKFFKQPSGMSPQAENRKNLPKNYYERMIAGKDVEWVKVYVHGEYGFLIAGQSMFQNYRDTMHCSDVELKASLDLPLHIGADFGFTPAAVIGQRYADGRWVILDELVLDDVGMVRFAERLAQLVASRYPEHNNRDGVIAWGDPAGVARDPMTAEKTILQVLGSYTGWRWKPAPTNDLEVRLEVVKAALNRLVDGKPGFLISPTCRMLRKGFAGGYFRKYQKSAMTNATVILDQPVKNEFSHPHDALQYLLLGGGEFGVVTDRIRRKKLAVQGPRQANGTDYRIYGSLTE